jgi:hypothetical protein
MSNPKEPHYFSSIRFLPAWRGQSGAVVDPGTGQLVAPTVSTETAYLALFRAATTETIVGESSTSYLADVDAPRRMFAAAPDARIVMVLRDPVARALSHYNMYVREGWESRTLEEAVGYELGGGTAPWAFAYVRNGLYHDAVNRYLETFGDRTLIVLLEELARHEADVIGSLWRFLGVPPTDLGPMKVLNPHSVPRNRVISSVMKRESAWLVGRRLLPRAVRHRVRDVVLSPAVAPTVPERLRAELAAYYEKDCLETERLLGRSLPWPTCGSG